MLVTYAFAAHAQQYNEYYYEYSSWYTAADNLALRKPVTQSSQLYSIGAASNAVDGIHDGRFWDGACSHTKNFASGNSWLDVDLGSNTTDVKVVVVSLRTDCCQGEYL